MTLDERILERLSAIAKVLGCPDPPAEKQVPLAVYEERWRAIQEGHEALKRQAEEAREALGKGDEMDEEDREQHGSAWMNG
jgi:hypothetical protein